MPQRVDPAWAKEVLDWWVEHADAALTNGRSSREFAFCRSGPSTDALLTRELQTRRVIKLVLGLDEVGTLVRPLNQHNFVELQTGLDLARRALGHLATAEETARHITGTSAPTMAADSLHPLIWAMIYVTHLVVVRGERVTARSRVGRQGPGVVR